MRTLMKTTLLLSAAFLTGCGGNAATNPDELVPLTEKDKQEIKQRDDQVNQEEGGTAYGKDARKVRAKR
jgi:outer membrane biogenesis lipoprotein LolB